MRYATLFVGKSNLLLVMSNYSVPLLVFYKSITFIFFISDAAKKAVDIVEV